MTESRDRNRQKKHDCRILIFLKQKSESMTVLRHFMILFSEFHLMPQEGCCRSEKYLVTQLS